MRIHYFTGMSVTQTKKYSDQIEDLIDHDWQEKAERLKSRRWKKIHIEEELRGLQSNSKNRAHH